MDRTASRRARVFREEEPGAHPKAHSTAAPENHPEGCPPEQPKGPGGHPPEQPILLTPLCQRRAFAGPAHSVPFSQVQLIL
jgi:hypothetical protein